jgi:hypothetical protein
MDYKVTMTDGTVKELKDTGIDSEAMSKIITESNKTGWIIIGKLYIAANHMVAIEEM